MTGSDGQPLAVREVAVELSLPAAGIEPLRAHAALGPDGSFTVESIALPVQGAWTVRVDALIGDFEKRVFTLQLEID
jgi:nitrogen fixation protein FixH